MFIHRKLFVVLVVLVCVQLIQSVSMGEINSVDTIDSILSASNILPTTNGLSNNNLIEGITTGAQLAITQCENAFKWDRWNCPETTFSRKLSLLPTREQAYAHAILAAAIVHELTRRCSRGELDGCGCAVDRAGRLLDNRTDTSQPGSRRRDAMPSRLVYRRHKQDRGQIRHEDGEVREESVGKEEVDWIWGGCSDDASYADEMVERVLDGLEKRRDATAHVHLHNNLVGRMIVRRTMVKRCRCHGVSGSCSMQTCWMQVAPFTEIANTLKQRYKDAKPSNYDDTFGNVASEHDVMKDEARNHQNVNHLVYLEKSPDYCAANNTIGWLGTKGRACSRAHNGTTPSSERRSCRNVCRACGLKVKKRRRTIVERCNCSFQWCCEVKCDTCQKTIEEYYCE